MPDREIVALADGAITQCLPHATVQIFKPNAKHCSWSSAPRLGLPFGEFRGRPQPRPLNTRMTQRRAGRREP
jgi:hypothetical protein